MAYKTASLKANILAMCDDHGAVEMIAGELWPAYCKCGKILRQATGIEQHWYADLKRNSLAQYMFDSLVSIDDLRWLKKMGVAI